MAASGGQALVTNETKSETTHVYLDASIVHLPKLNHVYHLKKHKGEMTVTFSGEGIEELQFFDICSTCYVLKTTGAKKRIIFANNSFNLVSGVSVPFDGIPASVYSFSAQQSTLYTFNTIEIRMDKQQIFSMNFLDSRPCSESYTFDNQTIRSMVTATIPGIPVETGIYPLFLKQNRPSHAYLEKIYQEFFNHNVLKIIDQARITNSFCHMRAHFVAQFLERDYGIQTFKIFKYWDKEGKDWLGYRTVAWAFHCAVMTVDDKNNFWVWDLWEGYHNKLLLLHEWVYLINHPIPRSVAIKSSVMIDADDDIPHPNFMYTYRDQHNDVFKALVSSATLPSKIKLDSEVKTSSESKALVVDSKLPLEIKLSESKANPEVKNTTKELSSSPAKLDTPTSIAKVNFTDNEKVNIFKKIYGALRASQTAVFGKTNGLLDEKNLMLKDIERYAKNYPASRTSVAYKLMGKYHRNLNDWELVSDIYQYSYHNSCWGSASRYKLGLFDKEIAKKEVKPDSTSDNTRTAIILRVLEFQKNIP